MYISMHDDIFMSAINDTILDIGYVVCSYTLSALSVWTSVAASILGSA
jgi:hypothetical protein